MLTPETTCSASHSPSPVSVALAELRVMAHEYAIKKGRTIYDSNRAGDTTVVMISGVGLVYAVGAIKDTWFDYVDSGSIIVGRTGDMPATPIRVVAHSPVRCLRMSAAAWADVCRRHPVIATEATRQAWARAAATQKRLVDIKTLSPADRLRQVIEELRESPLTISEQGSGTVLHLAKSQLADLVGVSERHLGVYLKKAAGDGSFDVRTRPRLKITYR